MERKTIEKRSRFSARVSTTEKHLGESKSSSAIPAPKSSYQKGLWAEDLVLNKLNEELIARRWRTPFGEVDLVVRTSSGTYRAVEVKCVGHAGFIDYRLTQRQKVRLRKVWVWLIENWREVEFILVLVSPNGECLFVEDFL